MMLLQLIGLLVALAAFQPIDALVFFGLRKAPLDTDSFVVSGIYRWLRHPMYAGVMLMLLAMPVQSKEIETRYRERIVFDPLGPVRNGPQELYGLRYAMTAWVWVSRMLFTKSGAKYESPYHQNPIQIRESSQIMSGAGTYDAPTPPL